ncbi:MAG: Membrane-associated phospholipid phosphatase [Caldanaerobacter subterraneus]|jgi:undecaprenyl-diphosphatase|uniref:Membrane-associated phospholipid phosphatase n=3 Tax=Caldanaerobacter subterraneus TaxID=911092 RepID=Q8R7A7_CALS4|nr:MULTISPECIES: phosphatase PAP2 family protein [Caldanaerobacter]AAM25640.1 Membrane-associated phospholipid phosphatase [Caldanaerobacter subterraneus subsp. tengcongensis MB4]KKC28894.1 membrane-associated phospholipid phosphatase [Caldanaerobacter subterraneus subsp. pacificus DSM 12653]KUK08751.1 MAG: Membrane-associated phospholipid phosphatase [Caldanaerobacter subterraneus]MCS3917488.1 undecaprenyl-diphosphatase [Caldanaerobacter subterraneus subsp. tengcongensis MB4]MDI3518301.1 unde
MELRKILQDKDRNIFFYINERIKCSLLDKIMPKITHAGGPVFTVFVTVFLALFGKNNVKTSAIEALFSLISSHLFVQLLKRKYTRPRPYMVLANANTFRQLLKDYSFPSGHATASFSLAMTFSIFFPNLAIIFVSLAVLVGLSRIYMGLHYPSDVLMGSTIGIAFAYLTHFMSVRIFV